MDILTGISHEKSERTTTTPAETVVICAGVVCITSGLLLPMCSTDMYDHTLIPLRLVMPGMLSLGGLALTFLGVRSKHRKSAFPLWKDLMIWLILVALYWFSYVTPLPSLYANSGDPGSTLPNDIRTAYHMMTSKNNDTVTVWGFCTPHSYGLRFELERDSGWIKKFWTLELENGLRIPVNGVHSAGIYTITYRKEDYLPISVEPYDPNCGENVLIGCTLREYYHVDEMPDDEEMTEQERRFMETFPFSDVYVVFTEKLEHPFPVTELRITQKGEIIKRQRLEEGEDSFFTDVTRSVGSDYFSAQIYAIYMVRGYEYAIPISNNVGFAFEKRKTP